jgi:hypothetical protein
MHLALNTEKRIGGERPVSFGWISCYGRCQSELCAILEFRS